MIGKRETNLQNKTFLKILTVVALIVVFAWSVAAAIYGTVSATDGDEDLLINDLVYSAQSGTLLPTRYNYPSFYNDISIVAAVPYMGHVMVDAVRAIGSSEDIDLILARTKSTLTDIIKSPGFIVYLKYIFIVLSLLAILVIFLLILIWRQSWWEALLTAILLAGSWEVNYHARYLAPNSIMMTLALLTLIMLAIAHRQAEYKRGLFWRYLAAACAGLVCGTKYQGGIFLFVVWIDILLSKKRSSLRDLPWREIFISGFIFSLVFLATTPGLVLQPITAFRAIRYEIVHYQTGHGPHTVARGLEHLHLLLGYIGLAGLSKYTFLNFIFSVFAVIGFFHIIISRSPFGRTLVITFILYVLVMINQRVMFIRNYQILIPFVAIFAGDGLSAIVRLILARVPQLPKPLVVLPVTALLAIGWGVNASWMMTSAGSLSNPPQIDQLKVAYQYIEGHPNTPIYISEKLKAAFADQNYTLPPNVVANADDSQSTFFIWSELVSALGAEGKEPPINRFSYVFFPLENYATLNPNYLDSPPQLIVSLSKAQLSELQVKLR